MVCADGMRRENEEKIALEGGERGETRTLRGEKGGLQGIVRGREDIFLFSRIHVKPNYRRQQHYGRRR